MENTFSRDSSILPKFLLQSLQDGAVSLFISALVVEGYQEEGKTWSDVTSISSLKQ